MTPPALLTPAELAPTDVVRAVIHGAETPRGRELTQLLPLHPQIAGVLPFARDGRALVGWDDAVEPRWAHDADAAQAAEEADVVFLCLPRAEAAPRVAEAELHGQRVIEVRPRVDALRRDDVAYGLPELGIDPLNDAERVATASSVATCAMLALGPLALAGHLGPRVEVAVTIGLASPGVVPPVEAAEREVQAALRELHRCPTEPRVCLDLQVEPGQRGMTCAVQLAEPDAPQLTTLYRALYAEAPCVEVLPEGLPTLPAVVGTNKAQLGLHTTDDGVEVRCALDDALKGSVGQAIQTMNLVCGFPETLGLPAFRLSPPGARPAPRPDL